MLFLLIVLNKKVENDQEIKREPSFRTHPGVSACLLTLSLQRTRFGSFPNLIRLSQFLAIYTSFQKKIPSSLDSALNFL